MDNISQEPKVVTSPDQSPINTGSNIKKRFIIIGVIIFVILVGSGGYILKKNLGNKVNPPAIPTASQIIPTNTQEKPCTQEVKVCPDGTTVSRTEPSCEFAPCSTSFPKDETANWKTYNISECLVRFKYPIEWQSYLSDKGHCQINYWQPPISSQPQDTFVIFDVQPEFFLGKQNIEINPVKIINRSQKDGIEKTIEYSEEKDKNGPIYLSIRTYFFKKGPIYFRILGHYKKGDNDFEKTLDEIAETVVFNGDESFYSNYIKNLESDLGDFAPKN